MKTRKGMETMMRLIDYFADWRSSGLFANLGSWTPWDQNANVNKSSLDWQYFGNRSGWRSPSPLLIKILPPYRVLTVEQIQDIDKLLQSLYADKWTKLWNAFHLTYTIGNDVDYTETKTGSGRTDGGFTEDGNANTNIDGSNTTTNRIAPFGSSANSFVDVSQQEMDTNTTSDKLYNTTHKARTDGKMYSDTYTLTKKGKTGSMTYSKAVEEEIGLRMRSFFDIIMSDIDDVLTIPYWG